MISNELMKALFAWCKAEHDFEIERTCDTLKCGAGDKKLTKVVVTMHATVNIIRQAQKWGAELIIVHEPTFYDHWDDKLENDPVVDAKTALLEETGVAIWRFHDHPHRKLADMIREGTCKSLRLKGKIHPTGFNANSVIELDETLTVYEIARRFRDLGAENLRICGNMQAVCKKIALALGTPRGAYEMLRSPDVDLVLLGEGCEWQLGEYARDAGDLGFNKALMIIGHIASEREGMKFLADYLKEHYSDEFETRYLECGEVYKAFH